MGARPLVYLIHRFPLSSIADIGGRQAPASGARIAFNQGLPKDPQRNAVWVDTYASEFSRDVEPTVEGGRRTWDVAAACIALYKANLSCAAAPASPCCTRADKEIFTSVWALARTDGSDYLLTALAGERAALVAGGGWKESCSAIPNPTAFCVDGGERDGSAGPFIAYNASRVPHPRGDAFGALPTAPLYRCFAAGRHFVSRDAQCEGAGAAERVLAWVALAPGWEALRALRRCLASAAGPATVHALDVDCAFPDPAAPGVLGYVR